MDEKTALIMTVSALQEMFRALASEANSPSYATVEQINSVFKAVNKIVPGAKFSTSYSSAARPSEVLSQLKLALDLLGHGSTSTTKGAQDKPAPLGAASQPAQKAKPKIFIGCSTEGLTEAKIIQMLLEQSTKVHSVIWNQGVFGLSHGTLETLVAKAPEYTYAILVLTPDDMLEKRDEKVNAARDNVLFELGLFMGALGRKRTFVVTEESVKLPSDLAGVATVRFQRGEGANPASIMGSAVTKLEYEMGLL